MLKWLFVFVIAVSSVLVIGVYMYRSTIEREFSCDHCNIILISLDTFGAKHSTLYDPTLTTTPFLASLASSSIVFDHAISQAPWTLPSHTAMLTGKYPWDLGIWTANDAFPRDTRTLASALKDNGYDTAAWSNGAFVQAAHNFDAGFDEFHGTVTTKDWNDLPLLFNEADTWLGSRSANEKPFFLFIRPFELHDPYGAAGAPDTVTIHDIVAANSKEGGPTSADDERFKTAYEKEVRTADDALKEFFNDLKKKNLLENTIVIITADHGEEFGEHGTAGSHSIALYDESVRVPLLVVLPSRAAKRIEGSVEVRSIPATTLDMVGLPTESSFQGPSLLPLMKSGADSSFTVQSRTAQTREIFLQTIERSYAQIMNGTEAPLTIRTHPYAAPARSAIIQGPWKGIQNMDGSLELYNTENDPEEKDNLVTLLPSMSGPGRTILEHIVGELLIGTSTP